MDYDAILLEVLALLQAETGKRGASQLLDKAWTYWDLIPPRDRPGHTQCLLASRKVAYYAQVLS